MEGVDLSGAADTHFDIGGAARSPPQPSPLGAGYLILVVRELSGLSQRALARTIGTSQPCLATLETGKPSPFEGQADL